MIRNLMIYLIGATFLVCNLFFFANIAVAVDDSTRDDYYGYVYGRLAASDEAETEVTASGTPVTDGDSNAAQTTVLDVRDFRFVAVYVLLTTKGNVGAIKVRGRLTGKAAPDKDTAADWGPVKADNLDKLTGISTVQDYEIEQAVADVGRFGPYRFPCDGGSSFSASVFVDVATGDPVASVVAYRSV